MICVSETLIKDGDNSSLYSLPGYVILKRNRNVGTVEGFGIFLKHIIKFKRRYNLENHLESLWIEICLISINWLLLSTSRWITNKEIIILDDFNIDYNKTDNRDFKSLLNIVAIKQVITKPTQTTET